MSSTVADSSAKDHASPSAGVPVAEFVEDVDEYMRREENEESAKKVLERLEEMHNKYKFMEYNLSTKRSRLKTQVPDIRASLNIVKHMKSKKDNPEPLKNHFQLADQLYVKAEIPPTDRVSLWLGANVMLDYSLDDADTLLEKNLEAAIKSLSTVEEDLGFLRDQTTTVEVNMARVYNWNVKRQQALKAASSSQASS